MQRVKYKEGLMEIRDHLITFKDMPSFTPTYSPREMLIYGVFGGAYFSRGVDKIPKEIMYKFFKGKQHINYMFGPNKNKNLFGEFAGSSYEEWKSNGWIHPDDPNGWYEWYIKFYYGRRHEDDQRQISRFRSCVSRHYGILQNKVMRQMTIEDYCPGIVGLHGERISPVLCQTLLQWAWNFNYKPNFK